MKPISERIKNILLVVLLALTMGLAAITAINNKRLEAAHQAVGALTEKTSKLAREYEQEKKSTQDMILQVKSISAKQKELTLKHQKLQKDLKNVSKESKAWLDQPIPSDIAGLLDNAFPEQNSPSAP